MKKKFPSELRISISPVRKSAIVVKSVSKPLLEGEISMKRRDFLGSVAAATVSTTTFSASVAASAAQTTDLIQRKDRKFVELRVYTPLRPEMKGGLTEWVDKAVLPALNRQSIQPVGAFTWFEDINGNDETYRDKVFLLIEHGGLESFLNQEHRLLADEVFSETTKNLLSEVPLQQVYAAQESSLLYCFPSCPAIEIPSKSPNRFVQLRRYKSRNQDRNAKKIEMFDIRGELDLFRRCNMPPVFFGEMLFGTMLPNLTYMLMFDSVERQQKAWTAFVQHPEWKKMSGEPEYEEKGLQITNIFLKPTPGSQI